MLNDLFYFLVAIFYFLVNFVNLLVNFVNLLVRPGSIFRNGFTEFFFC